MSDPNAIRTTHLTRDAAWELLTRYNKDAFHLHHAETVEKTMRYFARELGYAEEEDYWGIVGMLHDIDFEQWPQAHCIKSQALLKELGVEDSINRAVASHGYAICTDIAPEHEMEKILYAVDELTGLLRRRLLARRDTARGGPARLDAGRPHHAHHRRRPDV